MARQKIIVVFDTNALYQDQSPVHFVRKEIAELLRVHFVDVEVKWYVPGPVRKERESQLYRAATKLRHSLQLIEELTAASLNLDDEALLGHVKARISEAVDELGIVIFPLNLAQVDWGNSQMPPSTANLPLARIKKRDSKTRSWLRRYIRS